MDLHQACCRSPHLLGAVLSTIQHVIIVIDYQGKILLANPMVEEMFGIMPDDLEGKDLSILFTPEDLSHLYSNLLFMAGKDKAFEGELTLVRADKSRFFAFLVFRPYFDPSKDHPLIVVCIHDIDERKNPEEGLRGTHYEDLVKIADGIAHELRNPLVGIGGAAKRLYGVCTQGENKEKYYERILNNVRRLEGLVENVEFFAHLPKPGLKKVSIRECIQEAISPFMELIEEQAVLMVNKIQDMDLRIDKSLIVKTFSILIGNALDAMPQGGELTLFSETDKNEYRVYVRDTGAGISSEDLPYIFNPFFRTKPAGIGIDLAVVKRIMKRHSGRVEATSMPEKGTTFLLAFPLERRRSIRVSALEE
jgi:PAS domain S-box-containing protein